MEFTELIKLKSGTDVRGVAVGENITLTDEAVGDITKAFCTYLNKKYKLNELKIAVGNDPRISSPRISKAVISALIESGADVVYTGISSTPSMFLLLKESDFGCNASVMITASHLPYDKNGLKFFTPEGGLSGKDLEEVLYLAAEKPFLHGAGRYFERSFMDDYSKLLVKKVEAVCGKKPLKGKKIIVDSGNGSGGFFAEKVLKPLGAKAVGLFSEPDGAFPNHIPNPENKEAIDCLAKEVVKSKADLGIIFDTDVDRAACVDGNGEELNRNALIALLAAMILPEKGGTIVTDSVTSPHLTEFIESLGGKHLRYKRGYRNVIDKCIELNESGEYSPLAIETSGHAAFPENYYLDDGAYLTVKILQLLCKLPEGGKIGDLIKDLKRPVEEAEIRIKFNEKSVDFKAEGERVLTELAQSAAEIGAKVDENGFEGVRYSLDADTVLIRMSVHDPVMPINIESDEAGGCERAATKLLELLKKYEFLDLSNLSCR